MRWASAYALAAGLGFTNPPLWGQDRPATSANERIRVAQEAYEAGDFEAARKGYESAAEILGYTPEINYNLGLSSYRLGAFDEARKYFQDALATRDASLEARSKYNLGNTAYGQALGATPAQGQGAAAMDPAKAKELLDQAIHHYGDALSLNPEDQDARANIELAQRLIEQLEQQQQQQQQQQQDQQNQDQEQQQQDPKQEQQDSQQQNQEQQEQASQDQSEPQQSEQQQPSSEEQSETPQPDEPTEAQEEEAKPDDSQEQQEQAQEISEQEAEKILQSVRDKERLRQEKKAKAQRAQRAPVARDW